MVCSTTTFGAPGRGLLWLVLVHILLISMVREVEHSHHDDDVEMTEGVASSVPHASRLPTPGATVPVEKPPSAARALHVGKSQGDRQGPPHKLRAAERWRQLGSCFATLRLLQPRQTP